jgi:Cu+-exporting ATPase
MTTDPVCKMAVDEKRAAASAVYEGRTYYFCSDSCHKAFTAEPNKYVPPTGAGAGSHKR